jgi:beta-xylosidase
MKALIIEKESLEQMYRIREEFYVYPSTKGKMDWEQIDTETIIKNLTDDSVMVFTKKFGEVSGKDLNKFDSKKETI